MNTLLIGSYILLWIVVILLSLALFVLYSHVGRRLLSSREGQLLQGPELERMIEPQALEDLKGVPRTIGGPSPRPTLLLYLSVTCGPCRELIRSLPEAIHRFGQQIETIVVVRGKPQEVEEMVAGLPDEVTACADEEGSLITPYHIMVTPFALSLDRRGVLRYKGVPGSEIDNLTHFVSPLLRDDKRQPPSSLRSTPEPMFLQA